MASRVEGAADLANASRRGLLNKLREEIQGEASRDERQGTTVFRTRTLLVQADAMALTSHGEAATRHVTM
jgi:hypothetical protein